MVDSVADSVMGFAMFCRRGIWTLSVIPWSHLSVPEHPTSVGSDHSSKPPKSLPKPTGWSSNIRHIWMISGLSPSPSHAHPMPIPSPSPSPGCSLSAHTCCGRTAWVCIASARATRSSCAATWRSRSAWRGPRSPGRRRMSFSTLEKKRGFYGLMLVDVGWWEDDGRWFLDIFRWEDCIYMYLPSSTYDFGTFQCSMTGGQWWMVDDRAERRRFGPLKGSE